MSQHAQEPSDHLRALAAKGRQRSAGRVQSAQARSQAFNRARDKKAVRLITRSLGSSNETVVAFVGLAVVCGAGFGLAMLMDNPVLAGTPGKVMLALGSVVVGVGMFFGFRAMTTKARNEEIAWLHALPFGLDVEAYLDELGEERMRGRVTMRLAFVTPVEKANRSTIADAIAGAVASESRRWRGQDLVVVSPSCEAHFTSSNSDSSSTSSYNNKELHAWAKACLREGVAPIHGSHPVESVRIELGD